MSAGERNSVRRSIDLLKELNHSHVLGVHSYWVRQITALALQTDGGRARRVLGGGGEAGDLLAAVAPLWPSWTGTSFRVLSLYFRMFFFLDLLMPRLNSTHLLHYNSSMIFMFVVYSIIVCLHEVLGFSEHIYTYHAHFEGLWGKRGSAVQGTYHTAVSSVYAMCYLHIFIELESCSNLWPIRHFLQV